MGGNRPPHRPCLFSLRNSETVKAVTLAFSDQKDIIRDVRAKAVIPHPSQSPDIGQNSEGRISDL